MSYYEDERPRRHRSTRERPVRDDFDADPYYKNTRETSLVRRPRNDSFSSIEEVQREFPPAGGMSRKTPTRARSASGRDRHRDPYDDRSSYDDYYASSKRGSRRHDDRRHHRRRDSYSNSSVSPSPPRRRKSMGEQALAALGLGGAAATATKLRERSRSRSRHHRGRSSSSSSSSSTRSRRRRGKPRGKEDIGQVIKAAVTAGAAEALRSRKQPGGWTGEKGRRVFTAAITAGGVDKFLASGSGDHGTRNILGSTAAGLLTNRFVNGSRSRSRSRSRGRGGRGRARSESRSGLKELAGAGLLTAGAKKLYDRVRSKSRGRRSSTSSSSSYDSRSPRRHNRDKKKRSSSISAYASKGLAALGLGEAADKINGKDKRHSHYDDDDGYYHRRSRDGAPPPYAGGGGYADPRDVGAPRSNAEHHHGGAVVHKGPNGLDLGPHRFGDPETDSDSDLGSSSDDERARKSAQKKTLITAGLASVATIHAAHSVYQSMEKRDTRHMAVMQGDITSEEARKQKIKVGIQDAAAIGIAALGIKGAMSEWKDMKEKRQEAAELKEKQERHKQKREARRAKLLTMGIDDRLGNSAPQLTSSSHGNGYVPPGGPTYFDGNPYHAGHSSPPPPVAPFPPYQQQQYQPPMPPPPGGPPPPRF